MASQSQGLETTTSPMKHISQVLSKNYGAGADDSPTPQRSSKPLATTSRIAAAQSIMQAGSSDEDDYASYGDDGDASNDSYWFTSSDEDDEDGELGPEELAYRANRMVMFALYTHYDVIKEVSKFTFEYHLTKRENCQWDIAWYDGPITIRLLQRMQQYQRTNHFPGIYNLAKKNMLGRHLMRLQSVFPDDYNFFPPTYNLPADFKEFLYQVGNKRNKTFIVKPEASCQGKGIFLTRDPESLTAEKTVIKSETGQVEHMVVQRYMHKPYLIDGYKFDLRLYVLINGISPLRVYVYRDGLARFATVKYATPAPSNLNNLCMHLTNYAINKESSSFVQNDNQDADDVGSKRSYQFVLKKIATDYGSLTMKRVQDQINEIIVKTLCLAQPHVHHLYRSCQPDDIENSMCFQILGFDIMIDHKLKPSLIEVNQMPSFQTDSPLDYKIKQGVIHDCIALLNLSVKRRNRLKNQKKQELQRRLLKGYSHKIPANVVDPQSLQKPATAIKSTTATTINKPQAAENKVPATAATDKAPETTAATNTGASKPAGGDEAETEKTPAASRAGTHSSPEKALVQANSNTQSTSALFKTASRSNLNNVGQSKGLNSNQNQQVSKVNMRNLAQQSKQELIIKKRLLREQNERALQGGYELIYPFVTYQEEETIKQKVAQLQRQGHQGKSVKALLGQNAPQTTKEKIANMHNNQQNNEYHSAAKNHSGEASSALQMNRKHSQKTINTADGEAVKVPPQFGENTIEMAAIEKMLQEEEELKINDDEIQQGAIDTNDQGTLGERWLKQVKYENFMECARKMWDQFTSGSQINKAKRLRAKAEETMKQQADQEKKEKAKRDIARKNLTLKLRKQAEERRQKQEERIKMMQQIEEDKQREKEAVENGFLEKKPSTEKLNMAELKEQHRKLTNKIAESQKKVLEEGLRRNRKSSQFEKREVRKSINTLELVTLENQELRKSQQRIQGKPYRLQTNGPNMDYFKHIQQKVQDKYDQRKNLLQQSTAVHGMRITSAEAANRASITAESRLKPATSHSDLPKEDQPPLTAVKTIQSNQQELQTYSTQEKPKTSGFPLDHILPVFNLNKKEGNFIPTIKHKSKAEQAASNAFKDKKPGGLVKGSTVVHQHQSHKASADGAPGQIAPQPLTGAASQATLINTNKMQLISQKFQQNQAGFSFREQRKATNPGQTTSGVAELIPTNEFNLLPPRGMQVNPTLHSAAAPQTDVIPVLDSFRPVIAAKDFSESNFQLIQKIGGKRAAYQTTKQMAQMQSIEKLEKINRDIQLSPQFHSLEPVVHKTSVLHQSPKAGLPAPQADAPKLKEPHQNVTKINLDMDMKASHSVHQSQKHNFGKAINHQLMKNSFIKPPQADLIHKLSRKELGPLQGNMASGPVGGSNTLPPNKSNKITSLTNNIQVQRLPSHQRQQHNSKLGDLLLDVGSTLKPPTHQQLQPPAVHHYRPQQHQDTIQSNYAAASSNNNALNQMSSSGLKNMKDFVQFINQQPLTSPALEQPVKQSLEGELDKHMIPIRHAILPEISSHHKSKELKHYTLNGRSISNNAHVPPPHHGGKNTVQSDFTLSYQTTSGNQQSNFPHGHSPVKKHQNGYTAQKRRDSSNTHKNLRRHDAYNLAVHESGGQHSGRMQQKQLKTGIIHSTSTPPDQAPMAHVINTQQFERMNKKVGFKSYQAAELSEMTGPESSPLISSSFKRNLSVFRGSNSNQVSQDQGGQQMQHYSAQVQKHKNMFHTTEKTASSAAQNLPLTATGNAQNLQQASARSNIDMITGVSLRHQKEMLERAGIMGSSGGNNYSTANETGANEPLSLFKH